GLVGLNAMRHFVATLDGPAGRLQLVAAPEIDRTDDITPFIELAVEGKPTLIGDHAHWRIRIRNGGTRVLTSVRPRVVFAGGNTLIGDPIPTLAPGEVGWSRVKGSAGKDVGGEFTVALDQAAW
ncbi:MAG: hypothetical protein AAF721_41920, partial [Myxococcota bacterium]